MGLTFVSMIEVGKFNVLTVARLTAVGAFLTDGAGAEVLLPKKFVPSSFEEGEEMNLFVYRDSHGRLTATTLTPSATVNQFAWMEVKQVTRVGAFLDWDLEKDLLVPFREQVQPMELGKWYMVHVFLDEQTDRVVATTKLNRFFEKNLSDLEPGMEVDLLIWKRTDLGIKVIVNQKYQGLIFRNELFRQINPGEQVKGYIKHLRDQGKIDILLDRPGHLSIEPQAQKLLQIIQENKGFIDLNDKSHPDDIRERLGMSKKAFKRAVGTLYRQKLIRIEATGIFLIVNRS